MPAIKCAVVGTYSSGKTTLVKALIDARAGTQLLDEKPRRIIALTGNGAMRVPEVRDYLVVATLIEEAEIAKNDGIFIADGGLVNNLAHDAILLDDPPARQDLLTLFGHEPYDCVFWCDPDGIEIEDDGARFTDPRLRRDLHAAVGGVLADLGATFQVVTGSPDARLASALDALDSVAASRSL